MTILFDLLGAQPNTVGSKFHGGGEYSKTVFKALVDMLTNQTLIVFYDFNLFLDDWVLALIAEKEIKAYHITAYEQLSTIVENEQIDTYFSGMPYKSIRNILPSSVKKIGTFHGLRSIECPTDRYEYKYRCGYRSVKAMFKPLYRWGLKQRARKSYLASMEEYDEIVCVSNHTKYAIVNQYPNLQKPVSVFYTPAKHLANEETAPMPIVNGKYILLMGMNRWEKNSFRGIIALEQLFEKGFLDHYKVVTIGEIPVKTESAIKHKEKYVRFGYVEPDILESLYANCDFFLYPSLNEGFGMPPLEAMRYGKTCIVSGVCSLPEVCGNAVYYCNPYDIEEIQNRIIMSSEQKLNVEKVKGHFAEMVERQTLDLHRLCAYIVGETGR